MPPPTSGSLGALRQPGQHLPGTRVAEQHLPERDLRRSREPVGVCLEILPELCLLRHEPVRAHVAQELHLLMQASTYDRVVRSRPSAIASR